jgi:hypothetical protein
MVWSAPASTVGAVFAGGGEFEAPPPPPHAPSASITLALHAIRVFRRKNTKRGFTRVPDWMRMFTSLFSALEPERVWGNQRVQLQQRSFTASENIDI